jgi:hypothetical protein
MAGGFS